MDVLAQEAARLGVALDEYAIARFARYLELLDEWQGRAGLTAVTDREAVQRRHFGEALAPLAVLVEYALPLLRDGGMLAAPKGGRAATESAEAAAAIEALGGEAEPSLALPLAPETPAQQVLLVRRTGPLDERFPRRPG